MKIISCIKQVPSSSKVDVDPITGVLIRSSQATKMNPYDLYALEAAFEIKAMLENTEICSVTMGPPSAMKVLEEALYMGADDGVLLSDRAFAGADVLATSYSLSQVIQSIDNVDVVICGKQTTDGDTAQVGPEIAEFLGIPHVPYVTEIIEVNEKYFVVRSLLDTHEEVVKIQFPCLITVDKGSFVPRLPSYRRKMKMKNHPIKVLGLKDLNDQDKLHYGLEGSPTQVEKIFPPDKTRDSELIHGDKIELSRKLLQILQDKKFV